NGDSAREGNLRGGGDEVQFAAQVADAARGQIENNAVAEDDAGFETARDHLDRGMHDVLQLVEAAQPVGVERLDPAEEQLAAGRACAPQVLVLREEVVGQDRTPVLQVALPA